MRMYVDNQRFAGRSRHISGWDRGSSVEAEVFEDSAKEGSLSKIKCRKGRASAVQCVWRKVITEYADCCSASDDLPRVSAGGCSSCRTS